MSGSTLAVRAAQIAQKAASGTSSSVAIMALPAGEQHLPGPEEKHATILYFGDYTADKMLQECKALLLNVIKIAAANTQPFSAKVEKIKPLGKEGAQVWLLDSPDLQHLFNELQEIDSEVHSIYVDADVTHYPSYLPHVTIGYQGNDDEPALSPEDFEAAKAVKEIAFDRLALWWGNERVEFRLGFESKGVVRHVRTPEGAERFGQPIGSVIVPDLVVPNLRVTELDKGYYKAEVLDGPTFTVGRENRWLGSKGWTARQDSDAKYPEEFRAESLEEVLKRISNEYDPNWHENVTLTPPPKNKKPPYEPGKDISEFDRDFNASRARKQMRKILDELNEEYGEDGEDKMLYQEFEYHVISAIKEQIESARTNTAIHIPDSFVLEKILVDGRFKSQFETGTSAGALDNRLRRGVEAKQSKQLGVPEAVDPRKRPIYGAVEADTFAMSSASSYGTVTAFLKESISDRITVSVGDSLDWKLVPVKPGEQNRDALLAATAPHAIRWMATDIVADWYDRQDEEDFRSQDDKFYTEVQIHGGVGVDDIEAVGFLYEDERRERIGLLLDRMGIEHYEEDRARTYR